MENVVEIKHMIKTFGPICALNDVDFKCCAGEIHGLIGENGSGKSTITSIYAGKQKSTSGEMLFMGEKWEPFSMNDALNKGVGMIVQENGAVKGISVAENVFLGDLKQFMVGPFINRKKLISEAQRILDSIGASDIDAKLPTYMLDFQDCKLVEIARVMSKNPKVLVVDETTTALSQKGRKIIYSLMNKMKEEGKTVIFISHDLDEIIEKCDRLTVLRDGKIIRTFEHNEFDPNLIKTSMIGRELTGNYYRVDYVDEIFDEVSLELKNIDYNNYIKSFNMKLYKGEILGIGGLSHCGMHDIGKIIFGSLKPDNGEIIVNKNNITNEITAMKNGIGYVAKDRDLESLCLSASIKDNIAIAGTDKYAVKEFLLINKKENNYVDKEIKDLSIKCQNRNQLVSNLSGGNKQKVVFGKWVGRDSNILVLDCPTRGVDIGVKQAMYQLMYKMKKNGKSIILISEELTELIGMSDRLIIMKDGLITKEFNRSKDLSDADIINYMI